MLQNAEFEKSLQIAK